MNAAAEKRSDSVFGFYSRLPEEIVSDIFSRLPVKSLKRFECGCKSWSFLFRTQRFVSKHLFHSTRRKPCLLIDCRPSDEHQEDCCHVCNFYSLDQQSLVLEPAPYYLCPSFKIAGSCDGILCLFKNSNCCQVPVFSLWNPAISQTRSLPECTKCFRSEDPDDYGCFYHLTGFGFDSISNDYKFVLLHMGNNESCDFACEVYSCVAQSWTTISCVSVFKNAYVYPYRSSVSLRGRLYWLGFHSVDGPVFDLPVDIAWAFDLNRNAFDKIELPDSSAGKKRLCIYEENSLAVFCESSDSLINLWVARDGLVCAGEPPLVWTLLFTIREPPPIPVDSLFSVVIQVSASEPFALWGDEIVFTSFWSRRTFLYNHKTHITTILPSYVGNVDMHLSAVDYVESLVPISMIEGGKY